MMDNLNDSQLIAVKNTEGPVLVLAGAGSGKTKVLTTRIAYLVSTCGIVPESILAITFTNKAAKEMKARVINILGPTAYQIQISTFHSLGLLIMKNHYDLLGYQKNFTIVDSDDVLTIIKKIEKDLNIDPKEYNPRMIKNMISSAKNELIDAASYEKFASSDITNKVYEIYRHYERKLLQSNSLDFDDLLILPIKLFRKNPDILSKYQEQYKYLLVDEYQDTNEAQYILIKMLSAKYKNICVVGDNDQSIYGFRGSNYKNILNFEKDYPNALVAMLEKNYRSTKIILQVANDIIKNNTQRKDKNLWTDNIEGEKIKYHRSSNEQDEAFYVANEIKKLTDSGENKNDIAILYRTNAQSRNMEEALLRENIPYKVVGSFYFYNRKEIKDLICYLKLIYNPSDDVSLTRIINVPKRGIGLKTIDNLNIKATLQNKSMFDVIESGKELLFKMIIEKIQLKQSDCSLTELVDLILDVSGIKQDLLSEKTLEAEIRLENLEEFKSITKSFEERYGIVSLDEFLMEISLVADMEEHKNNDDVITLMTIHSAKGLEFDNVFLIGLEEGIFPHNNSLMENNLEEERRLCYVAVTRAKKRLWLINAKSRMIYGSTTNNPASRFLKEINTDYLDQDEALDSIKFTKGTMIDNEVDYEVGEHINHTVYGEGIIVSMNKNVLTVAFSHQFGIKTLIKGHISIKKVN